jgi:hypothetical protein
VCAPGKASGGANVFRTARQLTPVEVVKDVVAAGGSATAAEVDAVDQQAVDEHLQSVIVTTGSAAPSPSTAG